MRTGGSVNNEAGAQIIGAYHGVDMITGAGTVTNAGTITDSNSDNSAIALDDGGSVTNTSNGVILAAYHGVYINHGGTVVNAGRIAATGANTIAVDLYGGFNNRVVVDPGASFGGVVQGGNFVGNSFVSVLELAPGAGTLTGIGLVPGSTFENFGSIQFDPGAAWDISGATDGLAAGQTITGFAVGDTIELTGVAATESDFADGTLALSGGLNVLLPGSTYTATQFSVTNNGTNTEITVACFRAGTRILTDAGEVAVEDLRPGQRVVSPAHPRAVAVKWIGHRRLDCARHPRPEEVWPVRIEAHAFAPGMPHRALWLSPDHAVFVGGVLVPVRYLINGATIRQEAAAEVVYYHVELNAHDVLLADGLPAESYLDTGNRGAFENGAAVVHSHPDFARTVWASEACAQLVLDGPTVVAVRESLLARAHALGWRSTDAPAPLLFAGGQRILPHECGDDAVTFLLPPDCRQARLLSRTAIPAYLDPRSTDHRRLGLAVTALALGGTALPLDSARLGAGWHAPEPGLRWTDGAAHLTLAGERALTVRFTPLLRYWSGRDAGATARFAPPPQ
jgi:hypothetical protein